MSNSTSRWRTKRSSSTNEPGSSSFSMRSRARSLPRSRWRATAFSLAWSRACAPSSSSQRSFASVVSWISAIAAEPNVARPRLESRRDEHADRPLHDVALRGRRARGIHVLALLEPDDRRGGAGSSVSSTVARRSSSPPAPPPVRRSYSGCSLRADTVALAEGAYYGTGAMLAELARWGVRTVEFDQTGPPPEEAGLVWLEAPSNPFLTMPDFGARLRTRCPGRVRLDRGDATERAPARARVRRRHAFGHEVPRRARRRARRRGRLQAPGAHGTHARVPVAHGSDAERRHRLAPPARPRDARGPSGTPDGDRRRDRRPPPRTPGSRDRPLSGIRRSPLVRRRRRRRGAPGRDCHEAIENSTSLGGVSSRIEARARWEGDRVPSGLLRLSVGLEDADELWADLEQRARRGVMGSSTASGSAHSRRRRPRSTRLPSAT